jgi:hypothetical protein
LSTAIQVGTIAPSPPSSASEYGVYTGKKCIIGYEGIIVYDCEQPICPKPLHNLPISRWVRIRPPNLEGIVREYGERKK